MPCYDFKISPYYYDIYVKKCLKDIPCYVCLIRYVIFGQDVFEGACDCAREWNGLLWENSKKMHMVVKSEVHTYVRDFLRRQK